MIFKIKKQWLRILSTIPMLFFLMGCGLEIGEAPPKKPVYYFQSPLEEDDCFQLDYKQEIKNYFLDRDGTHSETLAEVVNCLSKQVYILKPHIYNEFLTREELLVVLDDDFIDFQKFKDPLKKILAPKFHQDFSLVKNYIFQLIDTKSALNPEALCHVSNKKSKELSLSDSNQEQDSALIFNQPSQKKQLSYFTNQTTASKHFFDLKAIQKEVVFSQEDLNLILDFFANFQKALSFIEKKSDFFFKALLEYEAKLIQEEGVEIETVSLQKDLLLLEKKRALNFTKLLEESLFDSFPAYSQFLKEQLEPTFNSPKASYDHIALGRLQDLRWGLKKVDKKKLEEFRHWQDIQRELEPFSASLSLLSDENRIYLIDIKYLFMSVYSMQFLFQKYDQNKNMKIDEEEIQSLSCLIEPLIAWFVDPEIKNQWGWVKNYYRASKITRYIFKYQEIPSRYSFQYLVFNPDKDITLSFREVSRLINLFFKQGMDTLKSKYPEEFESLASPPASK